MHIRARKMQNLGKGLCPLATPAGSLRDPYECLAQAFGLLASLPEWAPPML